MNAIMVVEPFSSVYLSAIHTNGDSLLCTSQK